MSLEEISRDFLKLHKVFRYRMKKVCDMSADEVIRVCHWYCEDNSLIHEFDAFRNERESACFCWTWDYSLADAKITNTKMITRSLVIDLDCSWTTMHTGRYVNRLIFENCTIHAYCDIVGCFWYSEQISKVGSNQKLNLIVSDSKNHKRYLEIQFSHVLAEK